MTENDAHAIRPRIEWQEKEIGIAIAASNGRVAAVQTCGIGCFMQFIRKLFQREEPPVSSIKDMVEPILAGARTIITRP